MAARNINTSANMGFGRFAAGSGGSVTVAINGARSRGGGVILLSSTASAAAFTFTGNDSRITILTLPADGAASLASGANQMPLTGFVSSLPPGGVLASGVKSATVGATLQVAPNQAPGNYTGSFQAILEFQ